MARTLAIIVSCVLSAVPISSLADCRQFFVQKQVVAAPVYYQPLVYYQAGRDIEAEALAAKVAKIVVAQLRSEISQPQAAVKQTAVVQHCAKCHSGDNPRGGVTYDGSPLACNQITSALRAISLNKMPKDHALTPEQKGQVMQELLDLEQTPPSVEGELK